jgi:DNA-binding response OmpR family regulator
MRTDPGSYVLVVDDDDELRKTVADLLRRRGYDIEVTRDTAAALAAMRDCPPGMVVIDWIPGAVDGVAVLRAMDADRSLAEVPVCVLAGAPLPELEARRDTTVLLRPVSFSELRQVIAEYCTPTARRGN